MKSTKTKAPKASRPVLPKVYGVPKALKGSVSWDWAQERLTSSHNYLITTVRPNGRPHTMVIWGIWLENAYYFSTGADTRKAKNLAANPHCVICNEKIEEAVIVEGDAHPIEVADVPKAAFEQYFKKYGLEARSQDGPDLQSHSPKSDCHAGEAVPQGRDPVAV